MNPLPFQPPSPTCPAVSEESPQAERELRVANQRAAQLEQQVPRGSAGCAAASGLLISGKYNSTGRGVRLWVSYFGSATPHRRPTPDFSLGQTAMGPHSKLHFRAGSPASPMAIATGNE